MNKLKEQKAITLIALVVTIIVLIILAGVSINLVLGDNGIITKAKEGKEDTIVEQEKEQVELAYVSAAVKKLGENVDKDDLQDELNSSVGNNKTLVTGTGTLNVFFYDTNHNYAVNNGKVSTLKNFDKIKKAKVYLRRSGSNSNCIVILKENGKLFCMTGSPVNSGYMHYSDDEAVLLAENVKDFYDDGYFLTNNNELYSFSHSDTPSINKLISRNVKEYFGEAKGYYYRTYYGTGYYIDTEDTLYYYNSNNDSIEERGKNVVDFSFAYYIAGSSTCCYLTKDKKLYASNGDLISENVEKIFFSDKNKDRSFDCYYITTNKDIYYVRYTGITPVWNGSLIRK